MPGPSSFDIGTYFNTLDISERLGQLIEWNEANSPAQLEYNSSCRSLFESIEEVITKTSVDRIIESNRYLRPSLDVIYMDSSSQTAGFLNSLNSESLLIERDALYSLCYLYSFDSNLTEAPYKLISFRDFFLSQIGESDNIEKGMSVFKQYANFSESCIDILGGHLLKHIEAKGSPNITSTEEFDQAVTLRVEEFEISFTHPFQVVPVLDLQLMAISSTIDPQAKIQKLPELCDVHQLTADHIKGNPSREIAKEILKRMCPHLFSESSGNIIGSSHTQLDRPLDSHLEEMPRESYSNTPISPQANDSDLIKEAITKAVNMQLCHESTIDIDKCTVDDRKKGAVSIFNKIGMLVCRVTV